MSKIFTNAELEEIERQKQGNHRDRTGLFSSRIRPKIKEMLDVWFPKSEDLFELIIQKKRGRK